MRGGRVVGARNGMQPDRNYQHAYIDIPLTQRYCCVMIPGLMNGVLPAGVHQASLAEVRAAFATTPHRLSLYGGLVVALSDLGAIGCRRVWLDGSYVTDKAVPGDYDLCWDTVGVNWNALDPALLDVDFPRPLQQIKYRGDVLPNVIEVDSGLPFQEFFQRDKNTGGAKGIIELALGAQP